MKNSRPNIIFYFSDQQRWDTLGCYGQELPVTPHLDRLAARGTKFENAFTCQPVCGPARACLQTGKYATQTGCTTNGIALPTDEKTIASYFNEAGYDTAYIGKWHLASDKGKNDYQTGPVPPERRGGYQYWLASDVLEFTSHGYNGYLHDGNGNRVDFVGYRPDCINNYAIDYIHNHTGEKPFFLFLSQIEPHHQNDHGRYEGPDGSKTRFAHFRVPGDLEGTKGDWRENYPDYLGCCHSLDENVGRLMDALEEKGIADQTIVIYTSDHGSHFKTRNQEYKRSCHDGCIHIPLIACGPGFDGGGSREEMVSLMDLPATLLDCAGIPIPEDFQGHSLRGLVAGEESEPWPDHVFLQISESQVGRCVRTKRWKYSVRADADGWLDPGAKCYYEDFLYDLEADPHEKNNLAADPAFAEVRAALAEKLKASMRDAGEQEPEILPFCQKEGKAVDSFQA